MYNKNRKLDADDEKDLMEYVAQLPIIMETTHEVHNMKGSELLEMGYVEMEGQIINPELYYNYNAPVQIAVNHYNRLKKAWIRHGQKGLAKYIADVFELCNKQKENNN